jgi:hypothetical protein
MHKYHAGWFTFTNHLTDPAWHADATFSTEERLLLLYLLALLLQMLLLQLLLWLQPATSAALSAAATARRCWSALCAQPLPWLLAAHRLLLLLR